MIGLVASIGEDAQTSYGYGYGNGNGNGYGDGYGNGHGDGYGPTEWAAGLREV